LAMVGLTVVVVVVVVVVLGSAVVVGVEAAPLPTFKITSSGGASASPNRDLVTQQFMLVLQRPSTLSTASQ